MFVDITPYLEAKLEAFHFYSHEVREAPHPRSLESLRARANYWGSVICRGAAEAFAVARVIR
jgi:hypothetical protein